MDPLSGLPESCPVGVHQCPAVTELRRLREKCRELAELSHTDALTGLYNFRYFTLALDMEMERTQRSGLPTGLIMIDLDHFKRVNDELGHEHGNEVLRYASRMWAENLRRIDIACRYGGEEFAVILPGTRLSQAIQVAERLRFALAGSQITLCGRPVTLTASLGVDVYRAGEDLSSGDFIRRTDNYLREAKAKGRNRVCHEEGGRAGVRSDVTGDERAALFIGRWPRK